MKRRMRFLIFPFLVIVLFVLLANSCKKDETIPEETPPLVYGSVSDYDGNVYKTIAIGTQTWMAENLKVIHFLNGDQIPNITDHTEWEEQTTSAYCWYNNNIANKATYGALYNFYSVVDARNLCPVGWHSPTDAEWTILENYLGGRSVAGGKLKATSLWHSPNTGATNSSGFTALPGGGLDIVEYYGYWWTASQYDADLAWARNLHYNRSDVTRGQGSKHSAMSVRCLKD